MSFLPNLGGANLTIGAQTAGLRAAMRNAVVQVKTDMRQMAQAAQTEGTRTAQGMNRVGTAAEKNAAVVSAAEAKSQAAMRRTALTAQQTSGQVAASQAKAGGAMTAGAVKAEAAATRWGKAFHLIATFAKVGLLGVVGAGAMGVIFAASWEKSFAAVNKTVGGTRAEMKKLEQEILGLSTTMPVSAGDLAKVAETAGALGIKIPSIKEFVRITAMIGSTTNVSTEEAATALGVLGNVLNLRTQDYKAFGSALVDLGNKGASTEAQILEITTRAASAGSLLGLRTQDILAISSTVAGMGVNPEAGGTALATIFSGLIGLTAKAAGGTKDLTKTRNDLRIAEQKLVEQRANSNTKASTLMATEARIAKLRAEVAAGGTGKASGAESLGKVAGITAKAWKDLIATNPEQAFQKLVAGLGKLSAPEQLAKLKEWGFSAVRTRNVMLLLAKNPGELARQLSISDDAWKKSTALQEEYAKGTANLLDRLKILWNVIKVELIKLGTLILPGLTKIVNVLAENIPGALKTMSAIWTRFFDAVKGPIGDVVKAVGGLFDAFSGGKKNGPIDWAATIGGAFDGLAKVIGIVAGLFAKVVDVVAELAKSPLGQFIVSIAGPLIALGVVLTGIMAVAGKVAGAAKALGRGVLGFIPGASRLFGGGKAATPEAQAIIDASNETKMAARDLKAAASALQASARLPVGAPGLPTGGPVPIANPARGLRNATSAVNAYPGMLDTAATGNAFTRALRSAGSSVVGAAAAGKALVSNAGSALASGIRTAASGVKGAAATGLSAVKGVGSLIGKLFFPLMIAGLVVEFAAVPISKFVEEHTGFKNVAALMATDFVGGVIALFQSAIAGTDAWVGHAAWVTVGKAKIATLTIAKMGFTSAEIGRMEAPTLENGGFDLKAEMARRRREQYATASPSDILREAQANGIDIGGLSIDPKGLLGNGVLEGITGDVLSATGIQAFLQDEAFDPAMLQPIIDQLIAKQFDGLTDGFDTAVNDALAAMGYSVEDYESLPEATKKRLGQILGAGVGGRYKGLIDYTTRHVIAKFQEQPGLLTKASILRARGYKESDTAIPGVGMGAGGADLFPEYPGMTGRSQVEERKQAAIRSAAAAEEAYKANLEGNLPGMQAIYARWQKNVASDPTGNRTALMEAGQQFVDVFGASIKDARPGSEQVDLVRKILGPDAIAKDAKTVAPAQWREVLDIYGQALSASGQNQRDAMAERWKEIILAGAMDGSKTAMADATDLLMTQYKAAIQAALNPKSTTNKQFDSAQAIKDAKKRKAAIETLFANLNIELPEGFDAGEWKDADGVVHKFESFGDAMAALIKFQIPDGTIQTVKDLAPALAAWTKAGMPDPTVIKDSADGLTAVASAIDKVGDAFSDVAGRFTTWLSGVVGWLQTALNAPVPSFDPSTAESIDPGSGIQPSTRRSGSPDITGATGLMFDTRGRTRLTVGEAGGEHVAVLRNFRHVALPQGAMPDAATPRLTAAGAVAGQTQHIYADKIQVLGPSDETSLLARFAFLNNT